MSIVSHLDGHGHSSNCGTGALLQRSGFMSDIETLEGGCACGAVRFQTAASPRRIGLCHCMTCRKAHASACNPFVVFPVGDVQVVGELETWESSPGHERRFCPKCGSRIAMQMSRTDEIELSLGSFDAIGVFRPGYESWVTRREPWLEPLGVPQNLRDRNAV